jgi:hypothetical protein
VTLGEPLRLADRIGINVIGINVQLAADYQVLKPLGGKQDCPPAHAAPSPRDARTAFQTPSPPFIRLS